MNWTPRQLAELDAEAQRKQQMRDAGVDASDPAEREAWEEGYDARSDEVERILHEMRARYDCQRCHSEILRVLENRLIPLEAGEPVRFLPVLRHGDVDPEKRRWLNGTCDGPVDNPDSPDRNGDIWVIRVNGRREAVFLYDVERRTAT